MMRFKFNIFGGILILYTLYACSGKLNEYTETDMPDESVIYDHHDTTARTEYHCDYYDNGDLREEGYLKTGKKWGWWKYYHVNGQISRGEYYGKTFLLELVMMFTPDSVKIFEGHYKGSALHGYAKYYYNNGVLRKEGEFIEDEQEGWWAEYNQHGVIIWEGNFEKGVKNGYFKYFENGIIESEGMYKNNIKKGQWKYYNPPGTLNLIEEYDW